MDLSIKNTILTELKTRKFDEFVLSKIFPILEKNIEKISFVKNFYGLNNILYIEEQGLNLMDFPMFLSIAAQKGEQRSPSSIFESAISSRELIVDNLNAFFAESVQTLYVEIAFIENVLDNDSMWRVFHEMKHNKDKAPYEIMIKSYNYPIWYNAPFSETINLFENSFNTMKTFEKHRIEQNILEINKLINVALKNNDFDSLEHLRTQLLEQKKLLEPHM